MLKYLRIIQDSARRIAAAANRTVVDYAADYAGNEGDFTGVMLGRMKQAMDGYKTRGVRWAARTHAGKAPNVQDGSFAGDFVCVVEFDLPDYRVKKGFLAHATHIERGPAPASREWNRMADQCRQMLSSTGESFVFIYARSGIVVVPALAIVSATAPSNPHDFYSRSALRFYQDHFECFVGDLGISSVDAATLARLRVRHGLYLVASQMEPVADLQLKLEPIS